MIAKGPRDVCLAYKWGVWCGMVWFGSSVDQTEIVRMTDSQRDIIHQEMCRGARRIEIIWEKKNQAAGQVSRLKIHFLLILL